MSENLSDNVHPPLKSTFFFKKKSQIYITYRNKNLEM